MKQTNSSLSAKNKFVPVFDARGRRIPRLLQRNNRFYLQKRISNDPTKPAKKIPLEAATIRQAETEASLICAKISTEHTEQNKNEIPKSEASKAEVQRVEIGGLFANYLSVSDGKGISPNTLRCYKHDLEFCNEGFALVGVTYLDQISTPKLTSVIDCWRSDAKKAEIKVSNYRIRKRLATLKRVLVWAKDRIPNFEIPFDAGFLKRQIGDPEKAQKRKKLEGEQIARLIAEARKMNGRSLGSMLGDLIELMAYSGLREQEAFTLRWRAVDFDNKELKVENEKQPQEHELRSVPFNKNLGSLLDRLFKEAEKRGEADGDMFVFQSNYPWLKEKGGLRQPRRDGKDTEALKEVADEIKKADEAEKKYMGEPVRNLRKLLYKAAERAGLVNFGVDHQRLKQRLHTQKNIGFHDLRRFFISECLNRHSVPANLVAKWVGHKDGGVLALKRYAQHDKKLSHELASKIAF
jgi:integrase